MITRPPYIMALLGAIEYALEVLNDYADVVDGDDGRPHANRAMIAHTELLDAYDTYKATEFPPPAEGEIQ